MKIIGSYAKIVITGLVCLVLGGLGCHGQDAASAIVPAVSAASADYLLRPGDILQVKVFKEENLTREVSVSQERSFSLPLIGTVDVGNKSVRQVEELVRQLYDKDYLVNPQVSVIVLRYSERTVNVMGAVNAPQAVQFPSERGLTLMDAITRAGGFSRLANREKVSITRTDEKGVSTTITINTKRLLNNDSSNQIPLQVGDVIFVPEAFM